MALTYLNLHNCTSATGDLSDLTGMALTSLDLYNCSLVTYAAGCLSGCTATTNIYLYNLGWDVASVNAALVERDGAAPAPTGGIFQIHGTNAAPTNGPPDGLAAAASLISAGVSVNYTGM